MGSFSEPRGVHSDNFYDMPLDKRMEKRGARGHLRFVGKRAHHRGHLRFVGKRDPFGPLRFAKRAAMGHLRFVKPRYYRSAPQGSNSSNEMVELLRLLEQKIRELQIIVKRRNV